MKMLFRNKKKEKVDKVYDSFIVQYLSQKKSKGLRTISSIKVESTLEGKLVNIYSTSPGLVIGPSGRFVTLLRNSLNDEFNCKHKIKVINPSEREILDIQFNTLHYD